MAKHGSVKPMHIVNVRSVSLTFKLMTWFLHTAHRLFMIICANNFDPTMQAGKS